MKRTLAALLAVACFTALAVPQQEAASFNMGSAPSYSLEPEVTMNMGQAPVFAREPELSFSFNINSFTHAFHFTRVWWLRNRLERANESRDEVAVRRAQTVYDLAVSEVMNDILWLGAPRELVILDEPE